MSDLQCPAKIILVAPEMLGQGASMPSLDDAPYSGVFAVSAVAGDAGEVTARHADHPLEILSDVLDGAGLARALDELADLYRGYTIVVVATHEMIRELMHGRDSSRPVTIAIDGSGWTVLD